MTISNKNVMFDKLQIFKQMLYRAVNELHAEKTLFSKFNAVMENKNE